VSPRLSKSSRGSVSSRLANFLECDAFEPVTAQMLRVVSPSGRRRVALDDLAKHSRETRAIEGVRGLSQRVERGLSLVRKIVSRLRGETVAFAVQESQGVATEFARQGVGVIFGMALGEQKQAGFAPPEAVDFHVPGP